MVKIPSLTSTLLHTDTIPNMDGYYLAVSEREGTATTHKVSLKHLRYIVAAKVYQSSLPGEGLPVGFYTVQTGNDRGLYFSSGVGKAYLVFPFTENGTWPV